MILVTGATGNIGSATVTCLRAMGRPVRALVRNAAKGRALLGDGVELAIGDLNRPPTLDRALDGVERVVLVSAVDERLAEQHANLVDAARRAGVRHIVRSSVLGAAADSPLVVGRAHWRAEQHLAASGIGYTHLRPQTFAQNLGSFFGQAIAFTGAFAQPAHGDKPISFVDARDVGAAAAATVSDPERHAGQTIELTGPAGVSLDACAAIIAAAMGKPVRYEYMAPTAYRAMLLGYGTPAWLADDLVALAAFYETGQAGAVTDALPGLLGRAPRTVEDYVRDHLAAFRPPA